MKRNYFRQGEHLVWLAASALGVTLLITLTLLVVVVLNGLGIFWPAPLAETVLADGSRLLGEVWDEEETDDGEPFRLKFKVGNRDLYGLDFRWVDREEMGDLAYPESAVTLERAEFGNFYGYLASFEPGDLLPGGEGTPWERLQEAMEALEDRHEELEALHEQLSELNHEMESVRLEVLSLRYDGEAPNSGAIAELERQGQEVRAAFDDLNVQSTALTAHLRGYTATFRDASGEGKEIAIADLVRVYRPNTMGFGAKVAHYLDKLRELVWDEPRESNTEGGLFPAIFGTVMLVISMSLFCIPLGVVAAIYLREYAKEGWMVRVVRIAVYNLAGVPSIVFGIFGLGFFIYGVGGSIDRLFFPERLPTPTFGTGGILWASLTLALMTVPVVIVTTEEALAAIPKGIREASLSLGATQFQTLYRLLVPIATPGIVTGFVLAMARAAGEVAPLMITGVVKLAPASNVY